MSEASPKRMDALMLLLKADRARRRRRSWLVGLLVAAVLVGPLAVLAWWVLSSREATLLVLAAYDQAVRPDTPIPLQCQLEPLEPADGIRLSGFELYFHEPATGLLAQVATDRKGRAAAEGSWPEATGEPAVFVVSYPGDRLRRRVVASGRVFIWPPETSLLIVDADSALGELPTPEQPDLTPPAGAVDALEDARGRYSIVYLSASADRPAPYLYLVEALSRYERLPSGPLLARAAYPGAGDADAFYTAVLADLKGRFGGPSVGVTRQAATARAFQAAGLKTFLLGDAADVPDGVTVVPSWEELQKQLR